MEKQQRTCLICGITDRRTFMFPQGTSVEDKLRYGEWLKFSTKFNPPQERLNMKSKRLCILHFEDKYISDPFRKNKVRNAIPTLPEVTDFLTCTRALKFLKRLLPPKILPKARVRGSTVINRQDPINAFTLSNQPPHNSFRNKVLTRLNITSQKSRTKQDQNIKQLQLKEAFPNIKTAFINQGKENVDEARSSFRDFPPTVLEVIEGTELACNKLQSSWLSDSISDADVSTVSESHPLLKESPSSITRNFTTHSIKGLEQPNLKGPKIIKSLLDKVHLKKKASVFVLPLKKKCDIRKLTKDRMENIIENMPSMDHSLKNRLLNAFRGKKVSFQCFSSQMKGRVQKARQKKPKCCTCTLHCNPKKSKPLPRVSQGLHVKLDGYDDSDEKRFDNAENVFSVSTFLSNVNDKVQIERLCQLVIESVFRLKNVNVGGTMSKIEIYICQDARISSNSGGNWNTTEIPSDVDAICNSEIDRLDKLNNDDSRKVQKSPHDLGSFLNKSKVPSYSNSPRETNKTEESTGFKTQKVKIDLNFFHDHSYLSLDSQVLFEKPPYIVKLVDIDTFRSSSKKTRIIKGPPVYTTKKMQSDFLKLQNQIGRLRRILKKRKENMDKIKVKLKYLGNVVCKEKGLKRIRYPRFKKKSDSKHLLENESTSENNEKTENVARNKRKKRLILTPDFELPSFQNESSNQADFETSEVSFDDKLDYFYETYLEDCIEKD